MGLECVVPSHFYVFVWDLFAGHLIPQFKAPELMGLVKGHIGVAC